MAAGIKAIVFKTAKLEATRLFFENVLQLPIEEISAKHFTVHSREIRLVFIESGKDFEIELYINDRSLKSKKADTASPGFKSYKDPNDITIIKVSNPI